MLAPLRQRFGRGTARLRKFLFENQNVRQTVAKNAFWMLVAHLGGRAARAVFVIMAARSLGADLFGVFSYALGAAAFFTIFGDLGLGSIVTRDTAQNGPESERRLATSLGIKGGLALLAGALTYLITPLISNLPGIRELAPLIAILVIADTIRDVSICIFRGKERMEHEAGTIIITNIAIVAFGFAALFLYPGSVVAIAAAYMGASLLSIIFPFTIIRREIRKVFQLFTPSLVRPLLAAAIPLSFAGIFGSIMLNTDLIMLGWFKSPADIGFYSAGQKIVQLIYILPAILASSIFPLIARLVHQGDHATVQRAAKTGMTTLLLVALPITIGGIILAAPLISLLFGSEYLPGTLSFQILLVSIIAVFPGGLIGNLILAYDKQRKLAYYTGFTALGNALLDILLIPIFGIVGCAIATLIMQSIYNYLSLRLLRKSVPFEILKPIRRILVASAVMGIATFAANWSGLPVIASIVVGAATYAFTLHLLREPALLNILALRKSI